MEQSKEMLIIAEKYGMNATASGNDAEVIAAIRKVCEEGKEYRSGAIARKLFPSVKKSDKDGMKVARAAVRRASAAMLHAIAKDGKAATALYSVKQGLFRFGTVETAKHAETILAIIAERRPDRE